MKKPTDNIKIQKESTPQEPKINKNVENESNESSNISDITASTLQEEQIAEPLITRHTTALRSYKENINSTATSPYSLFENTTVKERELCAKIQATLEDLSKKISFSKIPKNNDLAHLLLKPDNEFLVSIDYGTFTIVAEIGHLIIQRLREISKSRPELKLRANALINRHLTRLEKENVLYLHEQAFKGEIIKLVRHSLSNAKKVIWLGSARTVIAMEKKFSGEGFYLNCDDNQWSWELNRAWLQAAVALGYEFKLVEQHFPDVEKAILSQDPDKLLVQLAREMRPDEENNTSQYNGTYSPTATPQEILVLMHMGCIAHKNDDGSLSLCPSKKTCEEPQNTSHERCLGLKRTHSYNDFFKAAPLPPLDKWTDHFKDPGSSVERRANAKESDEESNTSYHK